MDERPRCKIHGTLMIRRRDPRGGELIEPPQWACGKCATDLLFGKRVENYIADDLKSKEEPNE